MTVVIIVLFILLWFVGLIVKYRKDIFSALNQWAKHKQEKDELLKMVYSNKKAIEQYAENRVHDREQSFAIQKELTDAINALSDKLDTMQEKQYELEEKHNKRVRAEMKDKISQLYRYYHEKKEWNSMEKEAFEDLIEEYEDAGGKNSFVHTIVQPESYLWEVVENV